MDGRLVPLTVDGLIYASSMVVLDSARQKMRVPALAHWLLGLGIAATLAANVAHGLGHGFIGAAVADTSTQGTRRTDRKQGSDRRSSDSRMLAVVAVADAAHGGDQA